MTSSKPACLIQPLLLTCSSSPPTVWEDVFERFVHVNPLLLSLLSDTAPHTTPSPCFFRFFHVSTTSFCVPSLLFQAKRHEIFSFHHASVLEKCHCPNSTEQLRVSPLNCTTSHMATNALAVITAMNSFKGSASLFCLFFFVKASTTTPSLFPFHHVRDKLRGTHQTVTLSIWCSVCWRKPLAHSLCRRSAK